MCSGAVLRSSWLQRKYSAERICNCSSQLQCTACYATRPRGTLTEPVVTYRLTEGLSSAREPLPDTAPQPALPAMGLSGACDAILAGVPARAGECRFVRVIRVLDPSRS